MNPSLLGNGSAIGASHWPFLSVWGIKMSELVAFDHEKDMRIEQSSLFDSETEQTPLSDIRCNNDSLNAESIVDQRQVTTAGPLL